MSRTEERTFSAGEKQGKRDRAQNMYDEQRDKEREVQDYQNRNRSKRGFN